MLKKLFSTRMTVVFLMGFSSGLPLLLIGSGSTFKARMAEAGVDLTVIGFFSLVGLPYTLKFLWAPFLDRYPFPWHRLGLGQGFGRRKGWLLLVQPLLALSLVGLAYVDVSASLVPIAVLSLVGAFLSATQDILIDSYRREVLSDEELGWGSSLAVNGYRVALLFAGAFALFLADQMNWTKVYLLMASAVLIGFLVTLVCREPNVESAPPRDLRSAIFDPFIEFFRRDRAWLILAFIVLYKIGDSMASDMTIPFYLDLGFTKTEIGTVAKLFGFWATIVGGLIGGALILKLGIVPALWIFGFLQAFANSGFSVLTLTGPSLTWLAAAITLENVTSGMATSAYAAFMASSTDRRFTATQYALLTSLMGIPRVILSAPTGFLAKHLGWAPYFVFCTLMALPGVFLIRFLTRRPEAS